MTYSADMAKKSAMVLGRVQDQELGGKVNLLLTHAKTAAILVILSAWLVGISSESLALSYAHHPILDAAGSPSRILPLQGSALDDQNSLLGSKANGVFEQLSGQNLFTTDFSFPKFPQSLALIFTKGSLNKPESSALRLSLPLSLPGFPKAHQSPKETCSEIP